MTKSTTSHRIQEKIQKLDSSNTFRLDVLVKNLCSVSRGAARGIIDEGGVQVGKQVVKDPAFIPKSSQTLSVKYDSQKKYKEPKRSFQSKIFKLYYEDNYLLVVEKQAGYLTVPTEKNEKDTLIGAVNEYAALKGGRSAHLVHRLDRETSGLLVLARNPNLAKTLKEQFADRKPEREYVAFVAGNLQNDSGTIRSLLATDDDLNQYSTKDEKKGKLAITHYRVEKRLPGVSVLRVRLETGRRNQIRVHLAEKRHPVIGDTRYEPKKAAHRAWPHERLALHATLLAFRHPVTKKKLRFECPAPAEFSEFLDKLEEKSTR